MRHILRLLLSVMTGLFLLISPLILAAEQDEARLSFVQLVRIEGATQQYDVVDYDGRVIKVTVPSNSVQDIRGRSPDGVVHATLASIDSTTNQAKVVTEQGQTLVLALDTASLQGLRIGDSVQFVLQ